MAAATARVPTAPTTILGRVLGLVVLLLFVPTAFAGLQANGHAARYLQDRKQPVDGFDRGAALDAAVAATPGDTRLLLLRASERFASDGRSARSLAAIEADLLRLSGEDPFSVAAAVLGAEVALSQSRLADAERALLHALAFDRLNPRAVTLLATTRMLSGRPAEALATLYQHPSNALREGLPNILAEFAAAARQAGRDEEAAFYAVESSFQKAMQSILTLPGSTQARIDLQAFAQALERIGHADLRLNVLTAAHFRQLGREDFADGEAKQAEGLTLTTTDRRLLQPVLRILRDSKAWQDRLGRG